MGRTRAGRYGSFLAVVLAACGAGSGPSPGVDSHASDGGPLVPDAGTDAAGHPDAASPADAASRADSAPGEAGTPHDASAGPAWVFGAPLGVEPPPFPEATHPLAPTNLWGSTTGPRPTNAAWEDLVLGSGEGAVNLLPYLVRARAAALEIGSPRIVTQATAVFSSFVSDFSVGVRESVVARAVTGFDAASVTMTWRGSGGGSVVAPLVRGMPYVTLGFAGMTPTLTGAHALTVRPATTGGNAAGTRFEIALADGSAWLLFASSPIAFSSSTHGLTATAPFSGTLRLARVFAPTDVAVLDAHRGAYAEGATLEARVAGGRLECTIRWKKAGTGPLLMATLPHHRGLAAGGTVASTIAIPTLRGSMVAVTGDAWELRDALADAEWTAPRPIDPARVPAVRAALEADKHAVVTAQDPYFFGKQVSKLGRLALIADELGEAATARSLRERMKGALDPWLEGRNADPLVYDKTWGGIVRRGAMANSGADFGMGYYNDHHYHFGYFLYAAAVVGKGDAVWLSSRKRALLAIARDIANPSTRDPAFAPLRHLDVFESHSWASGLFPFADGRNQESTSEAVNAWYGLALLGRALGDGNVEHLGRMLTTLELRGAKAYWQIVQSGGVYAEPFASKKVVGILWGGKVDYATWFGGRPEFIHGIQLLPFTPVSEALLGRAWVSEQYPVLARALGTDVSDGWRGYVVMERAVIERDAAWAEASRLTSFDDGNSKTNTLYWIATRP